MYEAYVTEEVVSKLPFDATCIEAYSNFLFYQLCNYNV